LKLLYSIVFIIVLLLSSCSGEPERQIYNNDSLWVLPEKIDRNIEGLQIIKKSITRFDTIIYRVGDATSFSLTLEEIGIDSLWAESVKEFHIILYLVVRNQGGINDFSLAYSNYLDALNYTLFCSGEINSISDPFEAQIWFARGDIALEYARKQLKILHEMFPKVENEFKNNTTETNIIGTFSNIETELETKAKILELIDTVNSLVISTQSYYSTCILGPLNDNRPPQTFLLTYGYVEISVAYSNLQLQISDWNNWPGIDKKIFGGYLNNLSEYFNLYSDIIDFYSSDLYRSRPIPLSDELNLLYSRSKYNLDEIHAALLEWVFGN